MPATTRNLVLMRLCTIAFIVGCGHGAGGLGSLGDLTLGTLSNAQRIELCEIVVANHPMDRAVECGSDTVVTLSAFTTDSCLSFLDRMRSDCAATVDDFILCNDEFHNQSDQEVCSDSDEFRSCVRIMECSAPQN